MVRERLSVILPAFNEAGNIVQSVCAAEDVLRRLGVDHEILVVDDGSDDATEEEVRRLQGRFEHLRLIRHHRNLGYGAALRSGLRAARGELIFFTDADLQFDIAEIERLLAAVDRYDIVAGYRAPRRDPAIRIACAWAWRMLIRALFGLQVRDIDCAFKVFRRRLFEAIPVASLGAFINSEILLRARQHGFTMTELPVSHFPRQVGRQSGLRPRVVGRALLEVIKLYRELRPGREAVYTLRTPLLGAPDLEAD